MLCETISYRWQFCIWQFLMVTLLLKILCCLLSGECSLKFMSFVIESPSCFEHSLTLQVLLSPFCNLGFCYAGFLRHTLWFFVHSFVVCGVFLLTLFTGQSAVYPLGLQLFCLDYYIQLEPKVCLGIYQEVSTVCTQYKYLNLNIVPQWCTAHNRCTGNCN